MGFARKINTGMDLRVEFESYGRGDYYSPQAYETIVEYFHELSEDVEVDVIALCSDFTEYDNPWDVIEEYNLEDWIDNIDLSYIDLSNVTLTINDWIELIGDEEYLYECLPEEVCYYDKEIGNYVIPDYDKMVSLGDLANNDYIELLVAKEIRHWDDFKDIVSESVDKEELFELVTDELNNHTTAWNLRDSVLFIAY